jgi:putative phage-type endonuclease
MNDISRIGFIGGSDAAAILGLSPWKTPYQLWEEKTGAVIDGLGDAQRDRVLNRGKRLEPVVMEMLQDDFDIIVTNRNMRYIDSEHDFLRCEIDFEYAISWDETYSPAIVKETGNGDVKTVHPMAAKDWGEQGSDEVPVYYVVQFQFGMMITGASVCCVAALIGADDLRVYYVPRDEEIIAMLREKCVAFWNNHIVPNVPPPITSGEDAERALRRFNGITVEATEATRQAITHLKEVKAQIKLLEAQKEAAEATVKLSLTLPTAEPNDTTAFAIVDSNGKALCTWNLQSTSRIDTSFIKDNYPDIAKEATKTATYRVLRVK